MNISGIIGNFKRKADKRQQVRTSMKAENLKSMREKRIKLEGRANISELESQERERLKDAKMRVMKQSKTYRAFQKVKEIKSTMDKKKVPLDKKRVSILGGEGRNVFE